MALNIMMTKLVSWFAALSNARQRPHLYRYKPVAKAILPYVPPHNHHHDVRLEGIRPHVRRTVNDQLRTFNAK